jgi:hypothetical protein
LALLALLPVSPAAATTLVVSTTDDLVNGDTSCPTALIANPGPDGISLREAILAVDNGPSCGDLGPDTITFDPSLAGQTITPATLDYYVTQANVSIVGLTDANGQPTVTIDASQLPTSQSMLLLVYATGFAMTSLQVTNLQTAQGAHSGIVVAVGDTTQTIQNISIINNQFINAPNLPLPGNSSGGTIFMYMPSTASGAMLANVTISGNTIEHFQSVDGILIGAGGVGGTIENVTVANNTFSDIAAPVEFGCGQTNCTVRQITIQGNSFDTSLQPINLNFIGNPDQASSGNLLDGTLIADNVFTNNRGPAITLLGGMTNATGNTISNTQIVNNLIAGDTTYGAVSVVGGRAGTTQNNVSGVNIVNNTFTNYSGGISNGGAVAVAANLDGSSDNTVSNISVSNTILWNNTPDFTGLTPSQVSYSITAQSGFYGVNGNIDADPLFVNPGSRDFHIQAGSPAIGAGTSTGAPAQDLDCVARPNPPSIGAYEPGETNNCTKPSQLTVTEPGSGSGTVTSSPPGINCTSTSTQCAASFAAGQQITLTASPGPSSNFSGWSGTGCAGTAPCTLTLTGNPTVAATFTTIPVTLAVREKGSGAGQVTSSPSGINCSATSNQCSSSFNSGTTVTLTASASSGSKFAGWSGGGCAGTRACVVPLSADTTVTATFKATPSFMLSVVSAGTGSGAVTSTPSGINCGSTCNASFQSGTQVALTAAAASGSTFAGWSGGGCSGIDSCTVTVSAATSVIATFVADTIGNLTLVAAVLPLSRSVEIGNTATAFATIIDAGPDNASTCTIAPANSLPVSFLFQTTDPTTNALTGTANTPIDITAGQFQTFVIALTPSAASAPTNFAFTFTCANAPNPAVPTVGIDTLELSVSTTPVPDVVALAASSDPGYVDIPGPTGTGVFAVATVNLGVDATITATANTGTANLPVTLLVCQTNPTSGACLAAPTPTVTTDIQPNATPTFGIFVTGSAAVPDSPGVNRAFVTFTDANGVLRGETSVAVRTQ